MVLEKAALVIMQKLLRQPVVGPVLSQLTSRSLFCNQVARANGAPLDIEDVDKMWQLNTLQNGHRISWKLIRYLNERYRFQNPRWLYALSRFEAPKHICWGELDKVSPLAVAQHLKNEVCHDAQLTIMEGVGHFCQLQAPEQWSDAILGYYKSI